MSSAAEKWLEHRAIAYPKNLVGIADFEEYLPQIAAYAIVERYSVKVAVNWVFRQIVERDLHLNRTAILEVQKSSLID